MNACRDLKLERESTWRRKLSTAVKCDQIIVPIVENNTTAGANQATITRQSTNRAKVALNKTINKEVKECDN